MQAADARGKLALGPDVFRSNVLRADDFVLPDATEDGSIP
jgi:hypothetical protein